MVHKMIKKTTEEWIEPKGDEEAKKILERAEKKEPEKEESEDDFMDDYDDGMDEFADSLVGSNNDLKKKSSVSDIRALG